MIYFIEQEGRYMKIGYTDGDVDGRLASLQTGNPHQLSLFATMPGDRAVESEIHDLFAPLCLRGEWYMISPQLIEYIHKHRYEDRRALVLDDLLLVYHAAHPRA